MHPCQTFSYSPARISLVICLALVCVPGTPPAAQIPAPGLFSNTDVATAGYFQLSWETSAERVELQESIQPDFTDPHVTYSGPDRAAVISGKPDGTWYYRIRALSNPQTSPWSNPVAVEVRHHTINRALLFLSLGIIIFIALVLMIVQASRRQQ